MDQRLLGVNIDHVATLRQARHTRYPDPVAAAVLVEQAGADQITVHLREDRRHVQDRDVRLLKQTVQTVLNLEMAATPQMVALALEVQPGTVTLVPERREELTTEGGLDVCAAEGALTPIIDTLQQAGIQVSLFIDANTAQIAAAKRMGAYAIELHTGAYCDARRGAEQGQALRRLIISAESAADLGLYVAAGHGLTLRSVAPLVACPAIREYNIGHSLVAHAVFVGLTQAVVDMRAALTSV